MIDIKTEATPPNDQSSFLTRGLDVRKDVKMLRVVTMSWMESYLEQGGVTVALFLVQSKPVRHEAELPQLCFATILFACRPETYM